VKSLKAGDNIFMICLMTVLFYIKLEYIIYIIVLGGVAPTVDTVMEEHFQINK
jgi:hypothetical protein